jgi:hypothetical protein
MSTAPADTALSYTRTTTLDGHRYTLTVTTEPTMIDTITVDLQGVASDGELTEGRLTVHTAALAHLGPLLSQTFNGLAALHGSPPPRRARRRRGGGLPTNSHQPWTDDLKDTLRRAWLAADPSKPPEQILRAVALALGVPPPTLQVHFDDGAVTRQPTQLIAAIAHTMKRSPRAIEAQLDRIGLSSEQSGPAAVGLDGRARRSGASRNSQL